MESTHGVVTLTRVGDEQVGGSCERCHLPLAHLLAEVGGSHRSDDRGFRYEMDVHVADPGLLLVEEQTLHLVVDRRSERREARRGHARVEAEHVHRRRPDAKALGRFDAVNAGDGEDRLAHLGFDLCSEGAVEDDIKRRLEDLPSCAHDEDGHEDAEQILGHPPVQDLHDEGADEAGCLDHAVGPGLSPVCLESSFTRLFAHRDLEASGENGGDDATAHEEHERPEEALVDVDRLMRRERSTD